MGIHISITTYFDIGNKAYIPKAVIIIIHTDYLKYFSKPNLICMYLRYVSLSFEAERESPMDKIEL